MTSSNGWMDSTITTIPIVIQEMAMYQMTTTRPCHPLAIFIILHRIHPTISRRIPLWKVDINLVTDPFDQVNKMSLPTPLPDEMSLFSCRPGVENPCVIRYAFQIIVVKNVAVPPCTNTLFVAALIFSMDCVSVASVVLSWSECGHIAFVILNTRSSPINDETRSGVSLSSIITRL